MQDRKGEALLEATSAVSVMSSGEGPRQGKKSSLRLEDRKEGKMETRKEWSSNVERFLALLAPRANPRFIPYSTRWDLSSVTSLKQLFAVTAIVIQNFPILHLVLDGGGSEVLAEVRAILEDALPEKGFKVRYWWVTPMAKQATLSLNGLGEKPSWTAGHEFQIMSPLRPAFHGGMDDIVIFLPPPDLGERRERWQDYLKGTWVVIVWEQQAGEQQQLIEEFKFYIGERARQRRHTPWLFKINFGGEFQHVPCHQHGIQPLPDDIRKELGL